MSKDTPAAASEVAPHLQPEGWGALIESMETPVILVVISSWMHERLKRHLTVEDVWQETLAMAWRDRDTHNWTNLRTFRSWLLAIAKNRIHDLADHMTAQKRGGTNPALQFSVLDKDEGGISAFLPHDSTTPSRIASATERAQVLEDTLTSLPSELEVVVRMRLFEEMPMAKVAEKLGIGRTTANERFFRGAALYQTFLERRLGSAMPDGIFAR